jgi:adenylate cyclase
MSLLAWTVNVRLKRPLRALVFLGLVLVAYAGGALVLYNHADFIPGLLYPSLALALAGLTAFGYDFALERREKARVRRSLERYVSRDVVQELLDNKNELLSQLGGARKDVAVLFSDVRGFTALSESADPELLVAQLNEYLAAMVGIVFRHHGTLDKFIGDAVMAVWGTVTSDGARGDCLRAVRAALAMLAEVEVMRRRWKTEARAELELGIGLNFGQAIFGNIGSEEKMEPTVIGDAVNLASRLEGATKKYGVPIILSGSLAAHVRGEIPLARLDIVRVKGRSAPVEIFTVPIDGEARPCAPAWLPSHEEGWEHYRAQRFAEAAACFALVPGEMHFAAMMAARCRDLAARAPGPDWEPVHNLDSK